MTSRTLRNDTAKRAAGFYFVIHFLLEVVCFYMVTGLAGDAEFIGTVAIIYNVLAFVPQLLIGAALDLFPKRHFGALGSILLMTGFFLYFLTGATGALFWVSLVILCAGNAIIHISGAELTIRSAGSRLSPVAIFVSGGSFGVITGQLMALYNVPFVIPAILGMLTLPLIIISDRLYRDIPESSSSCTGFDLVSAKRAIAVVIIASFLIVSVRSWLGYGIPTSWNKTTFQTILLFTALGAGKAAGGLLADRIGARKTAFISILGAVPFLIFGDRIMIVSLIGILFFSMTMSVTVGMLVSVMRFAPGAAFGITTTGLFAGTLAAAIIRSDCLLTNCILIVISSALCALLASFILKPGTSGNDIIKKNQGG